ncbi:MAG: rhodanese-like domain-containing protein [Acidimicrobiia bacterium]
MSTAAPTIEASTLAERLIAAHPPVVVDVRAGSEFETGHIPGACHVPLDDVGSHATMLASTLGQADVVLVCKSGGRARQAHEKLAAAGLPGATVLDGGMVAWQAAGGSVKAGRARWELERQVRLVAGSIVLTSTLVSLVKPRARFVAGGVGAGLVFAAVSNTCMMGNLLSKLPYNKGDRADVTDLAARLAEAAS